MIIISLQNPLKVKDLRFEIKRGFQKIFNYDYKIYILFKIKIGYWVVSSAGLPRG